VCARVSGSAEWSTGLAVYRAAVDGAMVRSPLVIGGEVVRGLDGGQLS
jgi:hypothetical protein